MARIPPGDGPGHPPSEERANASPLAIAADRDPHRSDVAVHHAAHELRDHAALDRWHAAQARVRAAAARDAAAHARDLAAAQRDQLAEQRDRNGAPAANGHGPGMDARAWAAADREHAARDRERAARDRLHVQQDREALLAQLDIAETDVLTGARTRRAGLAQLEHEIDRARRSTGLLVVAYVDVVGLKAVNDTRGHAAGDALLQRVVHAIRACLRSYDVIIRIGGDEFLCLMSAARIQDARERFRSVQAKLAGGDDPGQIRVGFAALAPRDSAVELIQRADADLPAGAAADRPRASEAAMGEDEHPGPQEDLDVGPQAPVGDVQVVELDHLGQRDA